jgi:hypothetical protein
LVFCASAQAADWSVVIFGGLDEEEIASYSDPIIEKILKSNLPANVEVIMQIDSLGQQNDARYIKRAGFDVQKQAMPEMDSANVNNFKSFLRWSKKNIQSKNVIFVLMAHSWGWKGLLQDFGIPGRPSKNTMMQVRDYSQAMLDVGFHSSVALIDACVLGNVESLDYLVENSDYTAVSQGETPYSGFPYLDLFSLLSDPSLQAIDVAKKIPAMHVSPFAREGKHAQSEGEYFFTSSVVIDSANWKNFRTQFIGLVADLKNSQFQGLLRFDPQWKDQFVDVDSNIDLVEFLLQLPKAVDDPAVHRSAGQLLKLLDYPQKLIDFNHESVLLTPDQAEAFEIWIQADENMKPGSEDEPEITVLEKLKKYFQYINQDLKSENEISFSLDESKGQRILKLSGNLQKPLRFRPWMQGTRWVEIKTLKRGQLQSKRLVRELDYVSFDQFSRPSIYLSEAHTQGSAFVHGIGINLKPEMDESEERAEDPVLKLKGPEFYKNLSWNKKTGWADLIFFSK